MIDELIKAVAGIRAPAALDLLARTIARGYCSGHISEAEMEIGDAVVTARREALKAPKPSAADRARRGPGVKRPERIAIRRRHASAGIVPPDIAEHLTTGEVAVLSIVGAIAIARGFCDRAIAEIAARAGVSRTLAKDALRKARAMGVLAVRVRPLGGCRNDTNILTIACTAWKRWLSRRFPRQRSDRGRKSDPHNNQKFKRGGMASRFEGPKDDRRRDSRTEENREETTPQTQRRVPVELSSRQEMKTLGHHQDARTHCLDTTFFLSVQTP